MIVRVCIAFLLLLLSFLTCKEEVRLNIEKEELIKVLVDVHLAESVLQGLSSNDRDSLTPIYYDQIYQIHEIDEESLKSDLEILRNDPDLTIEIYEQVIAEMTRTEANADQKKSKKKSEKPKK